VDEGVAQTGGVKRTHEGAGCADLGPCWGDAANAVRKVKARSFAIIGLRYGYPDSRSLLGGEPKRKIQAALLLLMEMSP